MLSDELLALWRREVADTALPYLWSDDDGYAYMDDAQKRFARLTEGLTDSSTASVTSLALSAGVRSYAFSPLVVRTKSVRRVDTGRDLEVINEEDMPGRGWYFDATVGEPRALVLGMDTDAVRVWPLPNGAGTSTYATVGVALINTTTLTFVSTAGLYVGQRLSGAGVAPFATIRVLTATTVVMSLPATAEIAEATAVTFELTLNLTVFRLPLTDIVESDQVLEIAPQHHQSLMLWMKARAYSKEDAETLDRKKAEQFEDKFSAYCAYAKLEQGRARHKTRVVQYGGI
jgi:hypothetical protein